MHWSPLSRIQNLLEASSWVIFPSVTVTWNTLEQLLPNKHPNTSHCFRIPQKQSAPANESSLLLQRKEEPSYTGCTSWLHFLKDLRFHRKVKKYLARLPSLEFGEPFDTMCKICPLYEAGTLLGRTNKIQKVWKQNVNWHYRVFQLTLVP